MKHSQLANMMHITALVSNGKYVYSPPPNVDGNIMTLLDKTGKRQDVPSKCFVELFAGSNIVLDAVRPNYSILKLPATKIGHGSYQYMFSQCPNVRAVPYLPAAEVPMNAYANMFSYCTGLTSVPKFLASRYIEQLQAYGMASMFEGCTNLSSVYWQFDTFGTYADKASIWLNNVAASGTFYCPYGLDTSIRDASHIPAGWNVVYTEVPESIVNQAAAVENLIMNND